MSYSPPFWITQPQLGSYLETYDFTLNGQNLILNYFAINGVVSLLNGSLPNGLQSTITSNAVIITGTVNLLTETTNSEFTYRVKDYQGLVADRTFYITNISVTSSPSWIGQSLFLGYFPSSSNINVTVTASTITTIPIVYSLLSHPSGMTIDPKNGNIVWTTPSLSNAIINENIAVLATTGNVSSEIQTTLIVVGQPYRVIWITPGGLIGYVSQGSTANFQLEAFDSSNNPIIYTLNSPSPNQFPFTINSNGLIYGTAPSIIENTNYMFTVSATSLNGTTNQTFIITVTLDSLQEQISWTSNANVGTISSGFYYDFNMTASSARTNVITNSNSVNYSVMGGQLPLGMTLNTINGHLCGFLEHTVFTKQYYWNQGAFDGIETIIRQCSMTVLPTITNWYYGITIPFNGVAKTATNSYVNQPIIYDQSLSVIDGILWNVGNLDQQIYNISNQIRNLNLQLGNVSIINVDSFGNTVLVNNIIDTQQGANIIDINNGISNVYVTPGSLNNWRTIISNSTVFENSANSLNGVASLLADIDPTISGVSSVTIINPGFNYNSSPTLSCPSPNGNNAIFSSTITAISLNIIGVGNNWTNGSVITVQQGIYSTPCVLSINSVNVNGGVSNVTIQNGGSYTNFPQGVQTIVGKGNSSPFTVLLSFGINQVNVIYPGSGYLNVPYKVNVNGYERLPLWQNFWQAQLPICSSNISTNNSTLINNLNNLSGIPWIINYAVINVQGIQWYGNTSFNGDTIYFDSGFSNFVETLEPQDLIFNENFTTFNLNNTVFDKPILGNPESISWWGTTQFDQATTIYELWATIFNQSPIKTHSATLIQKLFVVSSVNLTGNNPITNF